jgi:1,4-alpha-glucan branching enzyme
VLRGRLALRWPPETVVAAQSWIWRRETTVEPTESTHFRSVSMLKKKYLKAAEQCEVTFEYVANGAKQVSLVSDANGWQPLEMARRKKDGVFYAKVRLPLGRRFQYRYLLDGRRWTNDSAADGYVTNEFGEQNSVVDTVKS